MGLTDRMNALADRLEKYVEDNQRQPVEKPAPARRAEPEPKRPSYRKGERHTAPLVDDEVDGFMEAAGLFHEELAKRHPPSSTPSERDIFIMKIANRHPNRMRRIGRDFDWLRGQAKKYGIPPEDVKWLL